jgi:hypothetical protein
VDDPKERDEFDRIKVASGHRGDEWYRKFHQDEADRLRAIRFSWESDDRAA